MGRAQLTLRMDVEGSRFESAVAEGSSYRLEMDGATYRLWRPGTDAEGYRLTISQRKNRVVRGECACPDFTYRASREAIPCKHLWIAAHILGFVRFPGGGSDEKAEAAAT